MEQSVNQQNEGIYVEDLRLIHLKEEKLSQQFSIYPKLLIYVYVKTIPPSLLNTLGR